MLRRVHKLINTQLTKRVAEDADEATKEAAKAPKVFWQQFPTPPLWSFAASTLMFVQWMCIFTIFFGRMVMRKVFNKHDQKNYPALVELLATWKVTSFLLLFILGTILVMLMSQTGNAFEIYHGPGHQVWSSRATHRMPSARDIMKAFPSVNGDPIIAPEHDHHLGCNCGGKKKKDSLDEQIGHLH